MKTPAQTQTRARSQVRQRPARPALAPAALLAVLAPPPASAQDTPDFQREVQPILANRCVKCHGGVKKKAGLSFLTKAAAVAPLKSGNRAIVPGRPGESALTGRITHADPDERMPPDAPLPPEEITTLRRWIEAGAHWPQPWSFQPLADPAAPEVSDAGGWARDPLDRFVLAPLEAAGIEPSPEADRPTLIRRLSLDLTGLPPTPAEVDAFLADGSPQAYERVVDRLLGSRHFGERWGRHWLDQARYADSDGYEKDKPRPDAWRWRDWVIRAINEDLPFDQFTLQQIAGDLLPGATPRQQLATAFHRQTLFNTEGGVDPEEDRTKRVIDRINTVATAWLGLTAGCAQCHDHPYDPISQREFFSLYAFFNNADERTVSVERNPGSAAEIEALEAKLARRREALGAEADAWAAGQAQRLALLRADPLTEHRLKVEGFETRGRSTVDRLDDGSLRLGGIVADTDAYTLTARLPDGFDRGRPLTGFRLDLLTDPALPKKGPGRADNGNFVLNRLTVSPGEAEGSPTLPFRAADASFSQDRFGVAGAIDDDPKSGWAVSPKMGRSHHAIFWLNEPYEARRPAAPTFRFVLDQDHGKRHLIGRFKLSAITGQKDDLGLPKGVRAALATAVDKRSPKQVDTLRRHFAEAVHPETAALAGEIAELKKRAKINTPALGERTGDRRTTYVFHRGDFLQPAKEKGAVVPGTPAVLHPFHPRGEQPDRLDLARWLVDPANPLTARVFVNNTWSHLFGRALAPVQDDFGTRGRPPSHPELLDWLARQAVAAGWSRKALIRAIVTSATYRQASHRRPAAAAIDPGNRLLHRQNRFRVEAEIVRDLHLAAAGLLSPKVGGPSVFPPIPPDVAALSYANNFKWTTSGGADRYRRGMYTFFKRTAPDPNLMTFDCPESNVTATARNTSNTPIQALATLHNEVFVEAAQALAARALTEPTSSAGDGARLDRIFRLGLARTPAEEERGHLLGLLHQARQWYQQNPAQAEKLTRRHRPENATPAEAAAWFATARIILNLDEFITRE